MGTQRPPVVLPDPVVSSGPVPMGRPAGRAEPRTSPDNVRISMASAVVLRMRSGRFGREFPFGGINLLLSYDEGCLSDCGYCGLARTRPGAYGEKSFIRVEWPLVATDELVDRLSEQESAMTRLCISMVTHGHAFADTCEITRRIRHRVGTPLSVLVAPPQLDRDRLLTFRSLGIDMIGIGLDAATEDLFRRTRTDVPAGGLRLEKYWEVITQAREVFGPWKVNVHLLVGLGETDRDLAEIIAKLQEQQILAYLFSFNPEPDSRMADRAAPALVRWRRMQLVRHLVQVEGYPLSRFEFDRDGALVGLNAGAAAVEAVLDRPAVFMTNGCPGEDDRPGCTRPYGSYRPSDPFRDYPFVPSPDDLREIRAQLALDGLLNRGR